MFLIHSLNCRYRHPTQTVWFETQSGQRLISLPLPVVLDFNLSSLTRHLRVRLNNLSISGVKQITGLLYIIQFNPNLGHYLKYPKQFAKHKIPIKVRLGLINDTEFITSQIQAGNSPIFAGASGEIQDNETVSLLALKHNPALFPYISDRLKNNREFCLKAVSISPWCFEFLSPSSRADDKIGSIVYKKSPNAFQRGLNTVRR